MGTLTEKLEQVQFLTDSEGNRQAVVLDLSIWEELLSLVKALEPRAEGYFKTIAMGEFPAILKQEDDLTLEELVAQITPENMHGETSTGHPVGDEVW